MTSKFVIREATTPTLLGVCSNVDSEQLFDDPRYILEMLALGGEIIRVRTQQWLGKEFVGTVVGVQRYDANTARRLPVPSSRLGDIELGQQVRFGPEHVHAVIESELCAAHDRRQSQRPTHHARRSSDQSQALRSA